MARGIRHLVLAVIVLTVMVARWAAYIQTSHACCKSLMSLDLECRHPTRTGPSHCPRHCGTTGAAQRAGLNSHGVNDGQLLGFPSAVLDNCRPSYMSAFPDPTSSVAAKGLGPLDKGRPTSSLEMG